MQSWLRNVPKFGTTKPSNSTVLVGPLARRCLHVKGFLGEGAQSHFKSHFKRVGGTFSPPDSDAERERHKPCVPRSVLTLHYYILSAPRHPQNGALGAQSPVLGAQSQRTRPSGSVAEWGSVRGKQMPSPRPCKMVGYLYLSGTLSCWQSKCERTLTWLVACTTTTSQFKIHIRRTQYNLLDTPVLIQDAPPGVTFFRRTPYGVLAFPE